MARTALQANDSAGSQAGRREERGRDLHRPEARALARPRRRRRANSHTCGLAPVLSRTVAQKRHAVTSKITHRENVFPSAANVAFSNRTGGGARPPEIGPRVKTGKARKMDALLIGAPLGLGLLLALGGVMVVMSYLSQ
jgi:hypothetical protein